MNAAPSQWSRRLKLFWLIVGVPICVLWGLALILRLTPPYRHLHDFVQEWTSARNHFVGQPIYLRLNESIPLHFGQSYQVLLDYNAHPPASVLVSLPFCSLDYASAYLAWNLFSLATLVVSLWLIMRPAGLGFHVWTVLPLASFLLVSNSLAQQVNQGQLNLLLLLLLTAAWFAGRQQHDAASGVFLGLATAVKLFPGFLFLYLVAQRKWRAAAFGTLAFCALNGLTAAVLGWQCFRDYVTEVVPKVGEFRDFWPNASLAGYWSKLFDGPSGHVVRLMHLPWLAKALAVATCLAITLLAGVKAWRAASSGQRDVAFATCVIGMLLVSPITWDHYFLLLLLPLAILWKRLRGTWVNRIALLTLMALLCVLNPKHIWDATIAGDGELIFDPDATRSIARPWQVLTVVSYQFYSLLALFIFSWFAKSDDSSSASVPS